MEKVSYKIEKTETENGTEEIRTVSIEFDKEGVDNKFIRFQRAENITTISVSKESDDPHEEGEYMYFTTTIEDEKLKQTASYLGEMFLNIGKLAIMKIINDNIKESS